MDKDRDQREKTQFSDLHPAVRQLFVTALTAANVFSEDEIQRPDLGRTFTDADLGNRFHDIRDKHTIGMKAPNSGKK